MAEKHLHPSLKKANQQYPIFVDYMSVLGGEQLPEPIFRKKR